MQEQQQQQQQMYMGPDPTLGDQIAGMALSLVLDYLQRATVAPIERVMLLTAVEGELVRQGRLPADEGIGGVTGCFKRVWTKEGPGGFFRGLLTDAVLALPSVAVDTLATNAVFLGLYYVLPTSFAENMNMFHITVVSLAATSAAVLVASPYNAVRKCIVGNYMADIVAPIPLTTTAPTVEEIQEEDDDDKKEDESSQARAYPGENAEEAYRYSTATEAARSIYRRHGIRGFYRGAFADPITIVLYRGLYVAASLAISQEVQMAYPFAVARGLSVAADLISQPLEVVSRRLTLTASDDGACPYTGLLDCARAIVREEGVTALWSGLRFRLIMTGVSIGFRMLFAVLEGPEGQPEF